MDLLIHTKRNLLIPNNLDQIWFWKNIPITFSQGCRSEPCLHSLWPGPWFNIKMTSYQYRKSHCGDKTILRPSYLHNGISYTGKTTSLYWIRPLVKSYKLLRTSFDFLLVRFFVIYPGAISQRVPKLLLRITCLRNYIFASPRVQ